VFAGSLFPFVFITIACGALSGFHSLIASGTTPKMIQKEGQVRLIGYGGMLTESFVAIMALIAACVIDPGLYYAMNSPAGLLGGSVQSASEAVANLGFTITPEDLTAAAAAVEEPTLVARTGGAPTLAVGMSQIFSEVFGGGGFRAFWYHFAIMFEALFILTTVDAGTRVGRFMLQDTIGNVYKPMRDVSWKPGLWVTSAAVVGAWGLLPLHRGHQPARRHQSAVSAVRDRQSAARCHRAGCCHDPADQARQGEVRLGDRYPARLGRRGHVDRELAEGVLRRAKPGVLRPAVSLPGGARRRRGAPSGEESGGHANRGDELHRRRHTGRLFAILVVIIIADAARVWIRALRSPTPLPTTEAPHTESLITAPSGLLGGNGEDRRELAGTGRRAH